jgi:hypothetical protein
VSEEIAGIGPKALQGPAKQGGNGSGEDGIEPEVLGKPDETGPSTDGHKGQSQESNARDE